MLIARNAINGREARKRNASEKFGQDARARNTQSTFDKPLACVTGIFDHVFTKPLTWIAHKFDYTFDPLLTVRKGVSNDHLWRAKQRRSQVSKNGLYRLWSGWQRCIQRRSFMRVKDRQKRANEAFTKPLTTHLTRDKGDFSCRDMCTVNNWGNTDVDEKASKRIEEQNCFNQAVLMKLSIFSKRNRWWRI